MVLCLPWYVMVTTWCYIGFFWTLEQALANSASQDSHDKLFNTVPRWRVQKEVSAAVVRFCFIIKTVPNVHGLRLEVATVLFLSKRRQASGRSTRGTDTPPADVRMPSSTWGVLWTQDWLKCLLLRLGKEVTNLNYLLDHFSPSLKGKLHRNQSKHWAECLSLMVGSWKTC